MDVGVRVTQTARQTWIRRAFGAAIGVAFAAAVAAQTTLPSSPQVPLPTTPGQLPMQTPTADQLRMLQQLPESQRQELMRSLGITDFDLQRQATEDLRLQQAAPIPAVPAEAEEPEGPPKLEAGSTIIVKLRLPTLQTTDAAAGRRSRQTSAPAAPVLPGIDEAERELAELGRLGSNGTVDPDVERLWQQRVQRNAQLALLLGPKTYALDREGKLQFPGVATVPLAGLTEVQAARRIEAQPDLRPLVADVTLLPLEKFGVDALEPFGYELFQDLAISLFPATDIPVPPDYLIAPGDRVRVQLFGKENALHDLDVTREGSINFPEIGPIVVAGLTFPEMRDLIQDRVSEQMIGVSASVTMGELRSIRVFVVGDVERPGSYLVTGLSTMTNALYVSGGIAESGSLRGVQLKRAGRTVQTLDVYNMLLRGDSSKDARLQSNDVLFVPPRGPTVAIAGEVQRPAIYELAGERTLDEVIELAGGLTPQAFATSARVERVDPSGGRAVRTLDLNAPAGRQAAVQNGDHVTINPLPEDVLTDHVTLAGHVQRPGPYQWRPGMRLTDLVPSVNHLKVDADRRYVLIRRQADLTGPIQVFSADLAAALESPGGPDDPLLQNLDTATVFDAGRGRVAVIGPVLRQLRQQAVFGDPAREVEIGGMVHAPGTYPLEDGMRVSDLIRAGGNLTDSAYGLTADIARYRVEEGSRRIVDMKEVDLAAVLAGDPAADIALAPFDQLNIRQVSEWQRKGSVLLEGEVRFPGRYPIEAGETLSSVIARAGGLTDLAYPAGSVFLRADLKEREREQIDRLITQLESDIAIMMLQTGRAAAIQGVRGPEQQGIAVGQSILGQLRRADPVGRLVIDLPDLLAGNKQVDVILRDGDRLLVPPLKQEVMVLGEVQYATSHLLRPGLTRDDYLAASGGLTVNGDDDKIYIVRANGAVVGSDGNKWFRRGGDTAIRPGDAIVVPLNVDRVPALALWQASTSILYNLAVAVAAIGSL
jgi:protein involved in polysaccharide export with SLBB domain